MIIRAPKAAITLLFHREKKGAADMFGHAYEANMLRTCLSRVRKQSCRRVFNEHCVLCVMYEQSDCRFQRGNKCELYYK